MVQSDIQLGCYSSASKQFQSEVLEKMGADEIAKIVKEDPLIIQIGDAFQIGVFNLKKSFFHTEGF